MNKKLAVFDLDGTLLYTLEDLCASVNYALAQEALPLRTLDEVRNFVGNGILKLIERAVPPGTDREQTLRVFAAFKAHYALHSTDTTRVYEGVPELLEGLKNAGFRLGVVSNKADSAAGPIIAHYFPGVFDCVVGERENVRKKPAPDAVLEIIGNMGLNVGDCVYIGDSEVDIQTAENAGCDCISVSWGFKNREFLLNNGAKIVCDSAYALVKALGL